MDQRLKDLFMEMGRQEKNVHLQLYPTFKVTARKSESIPRRQAGNRDVTVAATADEWDAQQ